MSFSLVDHVASSVRLLRRESTKSNTKEELAKEGAIALYLWRYSPSYLPQFLAPVSEKSGKNGGSLGGGRGRGGSFQPRGAVLGQIASLAMGEGDSPSSTIAKFLLNGSHRAETSVSAVFPAISFQPPFLGENMRTAERTATEVLHAIVRSVMLDCSLPMTDREDRERIGEDEGGDKNRRKRRAKGGKNEADADDDDDDEGRREEEDGLNKLANQRQKKYAEHQEEIAKLLGKKKDPIMMVLQRGGLVRTFTTAANSSNANSVADLADSEYRYAGARQHSPLASLEFMMATPDQQRWKILQILLDPEISPYSAEERRHLTAILCFFASSCDHRTPYVLPDVGPDKSKPSIGRKLLLELNNFGFVYPIKWKVEEDGEQKGQLCKGFLIPRCVQNALVPSPSEQLQADRRLMAMTKSSSGRVVEEDDDEGENDDDDIVRLTRGLELIPSPNALLDTANANGIILETNFRLYAYLDSDSPLLGIICYFARLEVCLNHFYVFAITRQSFMRGLGIGLNTSLILHFLEVNSHPAMRNAAALAMRKRLQDEEAARGRTAALAIEVDGKNVGTKSEDEALKKKQKRANRKRLARLTDQVSDNDEEEEDDDDDIPHLGIIPDSLVDQFIMWEKEHKRLTMVDEESELLTLPTVAAAEAIVELVAEHNKQVRGFEPSHRGKRSREDDVEDGECDQKQGNGGKKKQSGGGLPEGILYHKDVKVVVTASIFNDCIRRFLPAKTKAKKDW